MERASFKVVARPGNYLESRNDIWTKVMGGLCGCCGNKTRRRMTEYWYQNDLDHAVNCLLFYRAAHEAVWEKVKKQWGPLLESSAGHFSNVPEGWATISPKDNYGKLGYIQLKDYRIQRDLGVRPYVQAVVNTHIYAKPDTQSDRLDNIHSAKRDAGSRKSRKLVLVGDSFQLLQDPGGAGFSAEREALDRAFGEGDDVLRSFNMFGDTNTVYRGLSHRLLNSTLRETLHHVSGQGLLTTADSNRIKDSLYAAERAQDLSEHQIAVMYRACCSRTTAHDRAGHDTLTFPPVMLPNYSVPTWHSLEKMQHLIHSETLINREAMTQIQFISRLQAMEQRHDREVHQDQAVSRTGEVGQGLSDVRVEIDEELAYSPGSPHHDEPGNGKDRVNVFQLGDPVVEKETGRMGWIIRVIKPRDAHKGKLQVRFDGGRTARQQKKTLSKSARCAFAMDKHGAPEGLVKAVTNENHGLAWYRFRCLAEKVQYRVAVDIMRKSLWMRRHRLFSESEIKILLASKELRQKQVAGELTADDADILRAGHAAGSVVHFQGFGVWWGAPQRHSSDILEDCLFLEFADNANKLIAPLYPNYVKMLQEGVTPEERRRMRILVGGLPGNWSSPWEFLAGHQGSFELITWTNRKGKVTRLTQPPLRLMYEDAESNLNKVETHRGIFRRERYLSSEHYYQTQKWKVNEGELNHRDLLLLADSTAEAVMLGRMREKVDADAVQMNLMKENLRHLAEEIMHQPSRQVEGLDRYRARGFQGTTGWEMGSVGVMLESIRNKFGIRKMDAPEDEAEEADIDFADVASFEEVVARWREDPHSDRQDVLNVWERNADGSMSELCVHVVEVDPEEDTKWVSVEHICLRVESQVNNAHEFSGHYTSTSEYHNGSPVFRASSDEDGSKMRETFIYKTKGEEPGWHLAYDIDAPEDEVLVFGRVQLQGAEIDAPAFSRSKELGWGPLMRRGACDVQGRTVWTSRGGREGDVTAILRPRPMRFLEILASHKTGLQIRLKRPGQAAAYGSAYHSDHSGDSEITEEEYEGIVAEVDPSRGVRINWRREEEGGPPENAFPPDTLREEWIDPMWWNTDGDPHAKFKWSRSKWSDLNAPVIVNMRTARALHKDIKTKNLNVQYSKARGELLSTVQAFAPWPSENELSGQNWYAFNKEGEWEGGKRVGGTWCRGEARKTVRMKVEDKQRYSEQGPRYAVRVRFEDEDTALYFSGVVDVEEGEKESLPNEADFDLQSWIEAAPEQIFEINLSGAGEGEDRPGLTLAGTCVYGFVTEQVEGPAKRAGMEVSHKLYGRNQWCRHYVTAIVDGRAGSREYDAAMRIVEQESPSNTHPYVRRPAGHIGKHVGVCESTPDGPKAYPIWHSELVVDAAHIAVQRILNRWASQHQSSSGVREPFEEDRILTLQVRTEWDLELRYFPSYFDHSSSVFSEDAVKRLDAAATKKHGGWFTNKENPLTPNLGQRGMKEMLHLVRRKKAHAVDMDARALKYWAYYHPDRNANAVPERGDNLYGSLLSDVRSELYALLDRNALARAPHAFVGWRTESMGAAGHNLAIARERSGSVTTGFRTDSPRARRNNGNLLSGSTYTGKTSGMRHHVDSTRQQDSLPSYAPIGGYLSGALSSKQSRSSGRHTPAIELQPRDSKLAYKKLASAEAKPARAAEVVSQDPEAPALEVVVQALQQEPEGGIMRVETAKESEISANLGHLGPGAPTPASEHSSVTRGTHR
eukprot:Hpha_TRINITY_DN16036_c3_g9::TRINITY_DN16036_c3_g9_i1::g.120653::m.120653